MVAGGYSAVSGETTGCKVDVFRVVFEGVSTTNVGRAVGGETFTGVVNSEVRVFKPTGSNGGGVGETA